MFGNLVKESIQKLFHHFFFYICDFISSSGTAGKVNYNQVEAGVVFSPNIIFGAICTHGGSDITPSCRVKPFFSKEPEKIFIYWINHFAGKLEKCISGANNCVAGDISSTTFSDHPCQDKFNYLSFANGILLACAGLMTLHALNKCYKKTKKNMWSRNTYVPLEQNKNSFEEDSMIITSKNIDKENQYKLTHSNINPSTLIEVESCQSKTYSFQEISN